MCVRMCDRPRTPCMTPIACFRALALSLLALASLRAQTTVADTQFSVGRGLYTQPFVLTITTATPGASIRYTLDCSDPRPSTLAAQGPRPLSVAIDPAGTRSRIWETRSRYWLFV